MISFLFDAEQNRQKALIMGEMERAIKRAGRERAAALEAVDRLKRGDAALQRRALLVSQRRKVRK